MFKKSAILFLFNTCVLSSSFAGVFQTPHFVETGLFSVGLEPELMLDSGAGLGFNLKYTHGITDLNNLSLLVGSGLGERKFRIGTDFTFDIFPDVEGQPGIGISAQLLYYRLRQVNDTDAGRTVNRTWRIDASVAPYVHKTFSPKKSEIEPFVSVPIGLTFDPDGNYQTKSTLAFGSMFSSDPKFRYNFEVGVAIERSESYFAAGFTYYHD